MNWSQVSLWKFAKAGLKSLLIQSVVLFVAFLGIFFITGGQPTDGAFLLFILVGIVSVAFAEAFRLRTPSSRDSGLNQSMAESVRVRLSSLIATSIFIFIQPITYITASTRHLRALKDSLVGMGIKLIDVVFSVSRFIVTILRRTGRFIQGIPPWLMATFAVLPFSAAVILVRDDPGKLTLAVALKQLLENAEAIALIVAVVFYVQGASDRRIQKHYEAWRVIDAAASAGIKTSYARVHALQNLHRDGVSLQWIEAPGANLAGIILPKANLRACNLAGANLENANLRGANLETANLAGANFSHANLVGCNLNSANLKGAILRGTALWNASLWEADLSGAELRWAQVEPTQLENATLMQTVLPDGSITTIGGD